MRTETTISLKQGYGHLIRTSAAFRRVWFGEIVSNFGDWFNLIASAALLSAFTGSGAAVGGLFVVRMLLPFLVSPVAGVVADRFNRKHVMIAADLGRALVVLGFLAVREPGQIWLLYVLTAAQLGISGFFVPARNAILPELVPAEALGKANALSSGTFAVMLAFGAGIGGLVTGSLGVYQTFLVDAASYLISATIMARVAYRPLARPGEQRKETMAQRYLAGLRHLRLDRESFLLASHKAVNGLVITGGLNVFMVALAVRVFPLGQDGSVSVGLFFCATGLGTAAGPLVARMFTGDRESALRKNIAIGYFASALGVAFAAPSLSLAMVLIGVIVRGVGGGMTFTFSTQLLMTRVPENVRGRVFGVEYALRTVFNAIGTMIVSVAVDSSLGLSGTMWVVAAIAMLPGALWWWWTVSHPVTSG